MIAVWESDISATFLIFRLKCSTDAAFFKFLGKLFHSMPRCKKSFVSNNWCLVWTGSAFPQSFLSCKNSHPFQQISVLNNVYKYSFYPRTIVTWNNLPIDDDVNKNNFKCVALAAIKSLE